MKIEILTIQFSSFSRGFATHEENSREVTRVSRAILLFSGHSLKVCFMPRTTLIELSKIERCFSLLDHSNYKTINGFNLQNSIQQITGTHQEMRISYFHPCLPSFVTMWTKSDRNVFEILTKSFWNIKCFSLKLFSVIKVSFHKLMQETCSSLSL